MPRKTYTREFKLQVVHAVESGALRPAQVCREYHLAESVLYRWRSEVQRRGEAAFTLDTQATAQADYEQRIAELEHVCGQLAVENAVLKKLGNVHRRGTAHAYDDAAAGMANDIAPPALSVAWGEPLVGLRTCQHATSGRARCGTARCD